MEVRDFYKHFITEDALAEISHKQKRNYHSVDEFTLYRKRDMENPYFLSWAVEELSEDEIKLLNQLKSLPSDEGIYTVQYNLEKYPFLTKHWLIVNDCNEKGVILESVVRQLISEYNKKNNLIGWEISVGPVKREILLSYAEVPIQELLRNIRINQLKDISKSLSFVPDSLHKEAFVKGISEYLTDIDVVGRLLTSLTDEDYELIKTHAENDVPLYSDNELNESLFTSGLIIKLENGFGITPYEVLKTLRETNFTEIEARRRSKIRETNVEYLEQGYNALKLKITLVGLKIPIYREIIIPTRLNFYELHIIIQDVFGWERERQSLAKFITPYHEVKVYKNDNVDTPKQILEASLTQVDPLLTTQGEMIYLYDYKCLWEHRVELMEYLTLEDATPKITEYEGPIVIEGVSGAEEFESLYEVLKDKKHPDFEEKFNWAKTTNYKRRYPKNAINRSLKKLFIKGYAITEQNDCTLKANTFY